MNDPTLIRIRNLTKSYGASTAWFGGNRHAIKAVDGVSFDLYPGEIHALMGQNGAGKSTLIKLLTGVHAPDAGSLRLDGVQIAPRDPAHAQRLGVSTVYQEVNLCPNLSVAENICAGRFPRKSWVGGGRIDWAAAAGLTLFLVVTALDNHRRSMQLHRTRRRLRDNEQALQAQLGENRGLHDELRRSLDGPALTVGAAAPPRRPARPRSGRKGPKRMGSPGRPPRAASPPAQCSWNSQSVRYRVTHAARIRG